MAVEFNTKGLDELEKKLRSLSSRRVREGFSGTHPSGVTNATLAYLLERGRVGDGHTSTIPARPSFTDSNLKLKDGSFKQEAQEKYTRLLKGEISQKEFLDSLGRFMENNHKHTLEFWYVEGSSAKNNAPLTIKRKGFDQPLIHHRDLLSNISYEVT